MRPRSSSCPTASRSRLHGYADRLELDDDGRVVVVDLKTGKYPPTDKALPSNPQLGLYQLAVDHGAVDDLVAGDGPASGGAELVQLRKDVGGAAQGAAAGAAGARRRRRAAVERAADRAAAGVVRDEAFAARRRATHCDALRLRADLPDQGRRDGAVMTRRSAIDTPSDLRALMGADFALSDEQWAAITRAARAGRRDRRRRVGKTTLMAARVVWLVATGQVAPRRGARPDLHHQGRRRAAPRGSATALRDAGVLEPVAGRGATTSEDVARADRRDLQRLRRRPAHRARPADRPRARHPGDRRRRRATSSAPGRSSGYTGRGRAPHRPPADRRSRTSSPSTAR